MRVTTHAAMAAVHGMKARALGASDQLWRGFAVASAVSGWSAAIFIALSTPTIV
jgi:hypothetical protein